jgi:hypothetical protein
LISEEFKNQLTSEIDSEQLMAPVNKINEILSVLKSKSDEMRDTRIDTDVPEGGFTYIKWPNSFRATIVQLDDAAFRALANAQSTLNTITLLPSRILGYVNDVRTLLGSGDDQAINSYLPWQLDRIKQTGQQAASLAAEVITQLGDFSNFVTEVKSAIGLMKKSEDLASFQNDLMTIFDETDKMSASWIKMANFFQTL